MNQITSPLAEALTAIAKSQLGKEEVPRGSNWGTPVQDYLASVNIKTPAPWCAAFVFWCSKQLATQNALINPVPQTGHALTMFKLSKKFQVVDKTKPKVGDVFTLLLNPKTGEGHTGIVTSVNGDGTYGTIEGNTNDDGSREGYEVAHRTRLLNSPVLYGFIRFFP